MWKKGFLANVFWFLDVWSLYFTADISHICTSSHFSVHPQFLSSSPLLTSYFLSSEIWLEEAMKRHEEGNSVVLYLMWGKCPGELNCSWQLKCQESQWQQCTGTIFIHHTQVRRTEVDQAVDHHCSILSPAHTKIKNTLRTGYTCVSVFMAVPATHLYLPDIF